MSRQFRSDDTSKWLEGFGNGQDGDLNYTGGNFGGVPGHGFATFSGTSGQYTGTFTDAGYFNGSNGGRIGDIVLIHQSQGTGAGNWELNKITNRSGSTLTFKYPLQNNYGTGAQIVSSANWNNVALSGTITPYLSWNGQAGGIFFLVVKGTLTVNGTINYSGGNGSAYTIQNWGGGGGTGGGFRGGWASGDTGSIPAGRGEGIDGFNARSSSGGTGGGGAGTNNGASRYAGGGAGGSYGSSGQTGASGWGYAGLPGSTYGNAELTQLHLGSGGGGGASGGNVPSPGNPAGGGSGGGIVFLLAKSITINGNIYTNGGNGASASCSTSDTSVAYGGGGGGSGGSVLLKCQTASLGSSLITATGGTGGSSKKNNSSPVYGGNGGVGRIHLDYKFSYSGSTNPTLDARKDLTLDWVKGGAFLYHFI